MQWHVYCRVVDNFGDIGIAWRLAADLARRGERVRLAVDDASALAWMAPRGAAGVEVVHWSDAPPSVPDVVVEMFGAGIPEAAVSTAAATLRMPIFVNVEHLSAEAYVERSHGLPSPHAAGDGTMRTTWFFYPGFTRRTGGLLREPGLLERQHEPGDAAAWLESLGIEARPGERRISVFCYANGAVAEMLDALASEPTLLLLTPGQATAQVAAALGPSLARGRLRAARLPYLDHGDLDRLLASCDLNLVRGEDSLVRAIWAGAPFVWQLYAQDDGAHAAKLDAFLARFRAGADLALNAMLGSVFARWNGLAGTPIAATAFEKGPLAAWAGHCTRWRDALAAQADLTTQLLSFVAAKR
ncbi:MAG: elongation factor P maturation arginine rhamnosyltransferase EarP [Caldimonas sp.]